MVIILGLNGSLMRRNVDQTDDLIYNERVSSYRTEALFLALTILFFLLLIWRVNAGSLDILVAVFFCLFSLFFFYSVNYRTLIIRLTPESPKTRRQSICPNN
jgi:Ca2+/Na+ antiporter